MRRFPDRTRRLHTLLHDSLYALRAPTRQARTPYVAVFFIVSHLRLFLGCVLEVQRRE